MRPVGQKTGILSLHRLGERESNFDLRFFTSRRRCFWERSIKPLSPRPLPAIAGSLGGLSYLAWVVTAYLLAATVAAPLYAAWETLSGASACWSGPLACLSPGSVACAVAPTLTVLICARALQGLGAGGLMTLAQALIGEVVSPRERGRFQGWFGANFALAAHSVR